MTLANGEKRRKIRQAKEVADGRKRKHSTLFHWSITQMRFGQVFPLFDEVAASVAYDGRPLDAHSLSTGSSIS